MVERRSLHRELRWRTAGPSRLKGRSFSSAHSPAHGDFERLTTGRAATIARSEPRVNLSRAKRNPFRFMKDFPSIPSIIWGTKPLLSLRDLSRGQVEIVNEFSSHRI